MLNNSPIMRLLFWSAVVIYIVACLTLFFVAEPMTSNRRSRLAVTESHLEQGRAATTRVHFSGEGLSTDLRAAKVFKGSYRQKQNPLIDTPARSLSYDHRGNLLAGSGEKLVSVDFADKDNPVILTSLDLGASITSLIHSGDQALVGLKSHGGAVQVDMSDPAEPVVSRRLELNATILDMVERQGVVYAANLFGGLTVVDLRGDEPKVTAAPGPRKAWRIARNSRRLALGGTKGELWLYDIGASGLPEHEASIDFDSHIRGLAMSEDHLFVSLGDNRLVIYDLSSWPQLHSLASLPLPGNALRMVYNAEEQRLVVSMSGRGFVELDVSEPVAPKISEHVSLSATYLDFLLVGNKVLGAGHHGVWIVEFTDGLIRPNCSAKILSEQSLQPLSWRGRLFGFDGHSMRLLDAGPPSPGPFREADRVSAENASSPDCRALIASGTVKLYQWRDDRLPEQLFELRFPEGVRDALFREERLFVATGQGVQVFDVAHCRSPQHRATLSLPGVSQAIKWLDPGFLLVAARHAGLLVLDVRGPGDPKLVAQLPQPRHLQELAQVMDVEVDSAGQRAFVAQARGGVQIVDISDPVNPRRLQAINVSGSSQSLFFHEDMLLVSDNRSGMFLVDVRDREVCLQVGYLSMPVRARHYATFEDRLIMAGRNSGTLSVSMPSLLGNANLVGRQHGWVELPEGTYCADEEVILYDRSGSARIDLGGGVPVSAVR